MVIGSNLIGRFIEKIETLHDEFLADLAEIEEAYSGGAHILPNSGMLDEFFILFHSFQNNFFF